MFAPPFVAAGTAAGTPAGTPATSVVTVVAVAGILTALGPYLPGEPPPATTLAASSLVTLAVVVVLGFVVEGRARWAVPRRGSP